MKYYIVATSVKVIDGNMPKDICCDTWSFHTDKYFSLLPVENHTEQEAKKHSPWRFNAIMAEALLTSLNKASPVPSPGKELIQQELGKLISEWMNEWIK